MSIFQVTVSSGLPTATSPVCSQRAVLLKVGHLATLLFLSFCNVFFLSLYSCSAHEADWEALGNSTDTGIYSHGTHTKPSSRCSCINWRCRNHSTNAWAFLHATGVPWRAAGSSAALVTGQLLVPAPRLPAKIHVVVAYLWWGLLRTAPGEQLVSSRTVIAHSCTLYTVFQLKAEVHGRKGFSPYFGHLCASYGLTGQFQHSLAVVLTP